MGNVCCQEPTNIGSIDRSAFSNNTFEPIIAPKLLNSRVEDRFNSLKNDPLPIDESKYRESKIRAPQRETNKNFVYDGEWKDEKPEGKGSIIFENGELFQGQFVNGKADGAGRYIFSNGDYYQGEISDNCAQGKGKYVGQKFQFEGTWEDSKPRLGVFKINNTGTIIQMTNDTEGTILWTNEDKYRGQIKNLNPNGFGKIQFPNGNQYQGYWRNGAFEGQGTYTWRSGQKYIGNYQNGIKHGKGTFYYLNNRRYQGDWKDGKQNGQGKLFQDGRVVYQGFFKDGVPSVQEPEVSPTLMKQEIERISYQNSSFYNKNRAENNPQIRQSY